MTACPRSGRLQKVPGRLARNRASTELRRFTFPGPDLENKATDARPVVACAS